MNKEKTAAARLIHRVRGYRYSLVLEGILVGAAAGLVTVAFRVLLEQGDALRQTVGNFLSGHLTFLPLWLLLLLVLAGAVCLLLRWEPYIGGSGIPQVEGEMHGALTQTWWRVLLAKFTGGLLTIGAGLSLGREGPSIQLGAMAGKGVSRLCRRERTEEKMLLTCGASAGLAAAFNAPFAGVLFSLEELHKDFSTDVLLSTMSASITADFLSRMVCGLQPVFDFSGVQMMALEQYWMVLVLGILLGAVGAFYNFCVAKTQDLYAKIPWPYVRTAIPFLLAGILLVIYPAVLGGGHTLVEQVSQGLPLQGLLLLFVLKFVFSMVSFGSGVPGGIFLPLLVLGALVGSSCSQGFQLLGLDASAANFVILGMAGMFSAIVRAPVTGIILISEMTGSFSHLLTLSLVSLAAYAVADLLRAQPVYDMLLARLLRKNGKSAAPSGEKVLVEATVCHGAAVCGKPVAAISWPEGALVVSVKRGSREFVPHGGTVLEAGDILAVLCEEERNPALHRLFEEECRT